MDKQVKSKQRVAEHGEVFTAEREVNAMLDLVKQETERIDSRFLEPACGDGNFLAEILRRKLEVVKNKYKKFSSDYEKYSILALTSIYGVDILVDNAENCRKRLFDIWNKEYKKMCKNDINENAIKSAKFILGKNIVCGNALSMMCVDENQQDTDNPIVFPEWAFITSYQLQRRDFRFDVLLKENIDENNYDTQISLFSNNANYTKYWMVDPVTHEKIPKPIKEFSPTDYRRIWEDEQ